jgi:pyruvate kinase
VAQHAEVVELSFANSVGTWRRSSQRLASLGSRQPAIVLKIETRRGFEDLPDMLLTAMRAPCCGVMIARGDLAVECGFERMAEVQEEILWICEAAHVPVIWATQVLETLAQRACRRAPRSRTQRWGAARSASCSTKGHIYVVSAVQGPGRYSAPDAGAPGQERVHAPEVAILSLAHTIPTPTIAPIPMENMRIVPS